MAVDIRGFYPGAKVLQAQQKRRPGVATVCVGIYGQAALEELSQFVTFLRLAFRLYHELLEPVSSNLTALARDAGKLALAALRLERLYFLQCYAKVF